MSMANDTSAAPGSRSGNRVFPMLLKREYWENRGGFFWAPVIAGGIAWFFSVLAMIAHVALLSEHGGSAALPWNDADINTEATKRIALGMLGDANLMGGVALTTLVLVFVVFFYCLGALYDERKDRSVLFWKSLPVSDSRTVLAKLAWALVLAPVLAMLLGLVIGVGFWVVGYATFELAGIPHASAMLTESHPLLVLINVLSLVPVYAFWALPTVGWLMLCSAWARTTPFLWAILIPVLAGALISWMDSLPGIAIAHETVWYVLGLRGLLSIVPGTWYAHESVHNAVRIEIEGPADLVKLLDFSSGFNAFATADLWIGAALGAAMIFAAIRLRRWRDEG